MHAGDPQESSHRLLATLSEGESYRVSGLEEGEVLSVQGDDDFGYHVTASGSDPGPDPDPDPGPIVPPEGSTLSQSVDWTCTSVPCPWGDSLSGDALVWPAGAGATDLRLGYTVSAGIYLPAARANGADISIDVGEASAKAGHPGGASFRLLATIGAGETFHVSDLGPEEVLSVQGSSPFAYHVALPPPVDPGPGAPHGDAIASIPAFWRCNSPDCWGDDWTGAVIAWPDWAAYQSNARALDQSRSVFSADDAPLYPYMGSWAQGCEVTAESGVVQIIEWQRGTDVWRSTWLQPGQSHAIALVPPEDGAMIETYDTSPGFTVLLRNCTPQSLPQ